MASNWRVFLVKFCWLAAASRATAMASWRTRSVSSRRCSRYSYTTNPKAGNTANNIRITKGWQGTNNISLIVSNAAFNSGLSYQWKKAPRGGGWRDSFLTDYNMSTFANVTAPNVGGAQSSIMTISNATLADSADYLVVLSNAYGMQTSFVATVMVLTTNSSVLVGAGAGDTLTLYTSDGTTGGSETFLSASDQAAQKRQVSSADPPGQVA